MRAPAGLVLLSLLALMAAPPLLGQQGWEVAPAPEMAPLFAFEGGWAGADGAYSMACGPGRVLWLFSDTLWGPLKPDGTRVLPYRFLHNSIALQEGDQIRFKAALFDPPDGVGWFWVGAGLAQKDTASVMLSQFTEAPGPAGFNFRQVGVWVADLDLSRLEASRYQRLNCFLPSYPASARDRGRPAWSFGAALLAEDSTLYVYGTRDYQSHKTLMVARCGELRGPWEYYTGSDWSPQVSRATEIADRVANEVSVQRTRQGDYLMVSQDGSKIQVRRGERPWGPFSPPVTIFEPPERGQGILTYNAKAHPELSDPERGLLISYNVNAFPPERLEREPQLYCPRFFRWRGRW